MKHLLFRLGLAVGAARVAVSLAWKCSARDSGSARAGEPTTFVLVASQRETGSAGCRHGYAVPGLHVDAPDVLLLGTIVKSREKMQAKMAPILEAARAAKESGLVASAGGEA